MERIQFKPRECSKCSSDAVLGRTICSKCHAEYMREWRKTHKLSGESKKKHLTRIYSQTLLRRGKIKKESCRDCGNKKTEMHHEDYSNAMAVVWLCRPCHMHVHGRKTRLN